MAVEAGPSHNRADRLLCALRLTAIGTKLKAVGMLRYRRNRGLASWTTMQTANPMHPTAHMNTMVRSCADKCNVYDCSSVASEKPRSTSLTDACWALL
jgi:hypothetical protein